MNKWFWRTWPVVAVLVSVSSAVSAASLPEEQVTPKFSHALPAGDGKTFTSVIVELPPGATARPHRHGDAFVYAFVLSGRVRSALDDQKPVVYNVDQDWFEPPGAHHVLTENVSDSQPARLLVVFVAPTGAPLKIDDTEGAAK
jgi:quercetin dioxygenase-like cupin family protein